jgi:hypothetical protein
MKAVGLRWRAGLIVATSIVRKQFSLLRAQFLCFHTKHCMGVLSNNPIVHGMVSIGVEVSTYVSYYLRTIVPPHNP